MIQAPKKLDSNTKRTCREIYQQLIEAEPQPQEEYVLKHWPVVLNGLQANRQSWHMSLAAYAKGLFELYIKRTQEQTPESGSAERLILAALHYLCDPYDLIPDFDPDKGSLDDAYVLNLCLKELEKKHPTEFEQVTHSVRRKLL